MPVDLSSIASVDSIVSEPTDGFCNIIQPESGSSCIPLTVRAVSGMSQDILHVEDAAGSTVLFSIETDGDVVAKGISATSLTIPISTAGNTAVLLTGAGTPSVASTLINARHGTTGNRNAFSVVEASTDVSQTTIGNSTTGATNTFDVRATSVFHHATRFATGSIDLGALGTSHSLVGAGAEYIATLPAVTTVLAGLAGTQTFTGTKTFNNNTLVLNGGGAGSGTITYANSATNRTHTIPIAAANSTFILAQTTSTTAGQLCLATATAGAVAFATMSGGATITSGGVLTVANDHVTYARMQNVSAASRLLGRGSAAGAGDPQELTVSANLSISGTVLDVASTVVLTSGAQTISGAKTISADVDLLFGGANYGIRQTTTGNDTLQIGVKTNTAGVSGSVAICDIAHVGNANRSPSLSGVTANSPSLFVYSGDSTQANEYIRFYHDGTDAFMETGQGGMQINSPSTVSYSITGNTMLTVSSVDVTVFINTGGERFAVSSLGVGADLFEVGYNAATSVEQAAFNYCNVGVMNASLGIHTLTPAYPIDVVPVTSTNLPAVRINQSNNDIYAFIRFDGTTATDNTKNVTSKTTAYTLQGAIKVNVNGTDRWIQVHSLA